MKTIADTMGVARSHLIERTRAGERPSRSRHDKADDAWLLPSIRELVESRATYGYRRICALLNRKLNEMEKTSINHKRVYRMMRQNRCCLHGIRANSECCLTKARSSPCVPTCAGVPMALRLPAGMGKWCALPSHWIAVIAKSSAMLPPLAALPARWCAT